ncbi:MAG: glycosyltransferase, partial [Treponema sp.]|nr:glycosyltransferase [Treponema sp.]
MKIAQFILTLGLGGAEAVVRDYAIELAERGHQVEIIVLFPMMHNSNENKLKEKGISIRCIYEEIFFIKKFNAFFRIIRKPYRTFLVRNWITKYVNSNKPDVLHCHLGLLRYIPCGICRQNKTRLFFTCHNEVEYYFGNKRDPDFISANKLIQSDDLHFFALHDRMRNELNKCFGVDTTEVMLNPIDLNRFQNPRKSKSEIRKQFGVSENDFLV